MKCWLAIAPCVFVMSSYAISASPCRESIKSVISSFEKDVRLPEGSRSVDEYARFYKVMTIPSSDMHKPSVSVVHFRYIKRNMKSGIYIVTDSDELPDDPLTDGGCLSIDGFFGLSDGKMISVECAAQR